MPQNVLWFCVFFPKKYWTLLDSFCEVSQYERHKGRCLVLGGGHLKHYFCTIITGYYTDWYKTLKHALFSTYSTSLQFTQYFYGKDKCRVATFYTGFCKMNNGDNLFWKKCAHNE